MCAKFKPGDVVRTPTGRTARVERLRPDGRREIAYIDGDRERIALATSCLRLVVPAAPRPWSRRVLD